MATETESYPLAQLFAFLNPKDNTICYQKKWYIPLSHYVQCVHYMAVTGADRWYLETLPFGRKPFLTVIERDEKEIRHLIELERLFWEENVGKQIEPMPDGSKRAAELLKKLYPSGDEEKECDLFA